MISLKQAAFLATISFACTIATAQEQTSATETSDQTSSPLELVAEFNGPMPTGVTVSPKGRIFINFPRWGDDVKFTVAELKDGKAVAFPDQDLNTTPSQDKQADGFVSVQSVVVDPKSRLWVLDTGSPAFAPTSYGGPKLVCINLETNKIEKKILMPADVALPNSYLNDVRFDLSRGKEGVAYITDSGVGGIIVVDIAAGKAWRRLSKHPATVAEKRFVATVEGKPLMRQIKPEDQPQPVQVASDGIAISPDGKRLYWCPLSSRKLYSIETDLLVDRSKTEEELSMAIKKESSRSGASDGLESDASGNIYMTDYENNAVTLRDKTGNDTSLVSDPRLLWPDTLTLADDGCIYIMANQLNRQPSFYGGKDMRKRPYQLFKLKTGQFPARLGK